MNMNDTNIAFDPMHRDTVADQNGLMRFFRIYQRWKRRHTPHQLPVGSVRVLVTERLRERELFLGEVRGQLLDLEASIDELTDTIRSMRGK